MLFILLFIFLTLSPAIHVYADNEPANVDESQLDADDTTPPSISVNIINDQILSNITTLKMTVVETNPNEYSIAVLNSDDSDVVVDGAPVGVTASGSGEDLAFDWDTTKAADGNYHIKFRASDSNGNVSVVDRSVAVLNEGGEPTYPPITPVLQPLPETPVATSLPHHVVPEQDTDSQTIAPSTKKDVLAARIQDAATAKHNAQINPESDCARFFGICWYWSAPALTIGTLSYIMYRFRQRNA